MRIVAGQFKGRPIQAPKTDATRPTSDRARESLFNMIAHADWAPSLVGARVIDLFAGSGALGLEALSRGASFCLFVETASAARGSIRQNIETLGLFGATRLHRRSATGLGERPAGIGVRFDIAFLDPPYHKDLVVPCLEALASGDWLTDGALIIVETAADEQLEHTGWTLVSERDSGAAKFWFLKQA
ncbi:MAG: 16S rRNA (guanine(966)-N(2))-methyltransferase RsmD [Pseudomonadota bacterium]